MSRLSILSSNGDGSSIGKFDWAGAVIDGLILSAISFFSTYVGSTAAGLTEVQLCKVAGIAASLQFFMYLAIKRGLKKEAK